LDVSRTENRVSFFEHWRPQRSECELRFVGLRSRDREAGPRLSRQTKRLMAQRVIPGRR
jgi:hypothetical protein